MDDTVEDGFAQSHDVKMEFGCVLPPRSRTVFVETAVPRFFIHEYDLREPVFPNTIPSRSPVG